MEKKNRIEYQVVKTEQDKELFWSVCVLCIIGLMAVVSASLPMCLTKHINAFHYVIQHIMWLILGGAGLYWFSKHDYKGLKKYTIMFAFFIIALLLIIKFTPLGVTINGAKRWLNLGFFQFQPSEFSKIAIIMLLANLFSFKKDVLQQVWPKYLITMGIMIALIFKQPNLSMTLILLAISFCMYICSGKSLKFIYVGFAIVLCLFAMVKANMIDITKFIDPYQIIRIVNWKKPNADVLGDGYQVFHSRIAIASGSIFGEGFGGSKEKLGWLPEAHTDFIFSVISEEMGFIGSFFVILLFLLLFHRGFYIAFKSPDTYGRLLAIGITIAITLQAFFNISVATAFLPATGITLPFISYGGSSLFVSLCMIGILLNISKTQVKRVGMHLVREPRIR